MHETINVHSNNIPTGDTAAPSVAAQRLSSDFSYMTAFEMSQRFCERLNRGAKRTSYECGTDMHDCASTADFFDVRHWTSCPNEATDDDTPATRASVSTGTGLAGVTYHGE